MEASSRSRKLTSSRNVRSALLAVAIFALVFLIALGTGRSAGPFGAPESTPGGMLAWNVLYLGLLTLVTVGACLIAYLLLSRAGRRRRRDDGLQRVNVLEIPWWGHVLAALFVLALVAAVILVFIFLRGDGQQVTPAPGALPPTPFPDSGAQPGPPATVVPLQWWLLGVVGATVLVGLGSILLRRRRKAITPQVTARSPRRRALQDVVVASLDDLAREPDARRAVIRAYADMERVLAEHDLGRRPYEAPVEYLMRWLGCLEIGRSAGARLTELYQRARFSTHTVDADMKRDAIGALAALRDELAGEGP